MLKTLAMACSASLLALASAPPSGALAQPAELAPSGPIVELGDEQPRPDEVQLDPSLTNPEEPTPYLEEAWALADALRRLHPDRFGGLWREPDGLVIGVVDDPEAIEASVASLFPDPTFVTYRSVDWSEAALENARSKFEARLQVLFDEQEVHALSVDVKRNRVYLETVRNPAAVRWERFVSGIPASMVLVEQGQPPQLLGRSGAPPNSDNLSGGLHIRIAALAALAALALAWRQRLVHPSRGMNQRLHVWHLGSRASR
jgi:hypothetical protein